MTPSHLITISQEQTRPHTKTSGMMTPDASQADGLRVSQGPTASWWEQLAPTGSGGDSKPGLPGPVNTLTLSSEPWHQ